MQRRSHTPSDQSNVSRGAGSGQATNRYVRIEGGPREGHGAQARHDPYREPRHLIDETRRSAEGHRYAIRDPYRDLADRGASQLAAESQWSAGDQRVIRDPRRELADQGVSAQADYHRVIRDPRDNLADQGASFPGHSGRETAVPISPRTPARESNASIFPQAASSAGRPLPQFRLPQDSDVYVTSDSSFSGDSSFVTRATPSSLRQRANRLMAEVSDFRRDYLVYHYDVDRSLREFDSNPFALLSAVSRMLVLEDPTYREPLEQAQSRSPNLRVCVPEQTRALSENRGYGAGDWHSTSEWGRRTWETDVDAMWRPPPPIQPSALRGTDLRSAPYTMGSLLHGDISPAAFARSSSAAEPAITMGARLSTDRQQNASEVTGPQPVESSSVSRPPVRELSATSSVNRAPVQEPEQQLEGFWEVLPTVTKRSDDTSQSVRSVTVPSAGVRPPTQVVPNKPPPSATQPKPLSAEEEARRKQKKNRRRTCFNCLQKGHFQDDCPLRVVSMAESASVEQSMDTTEPILSLEPDLSDASETLQVQAESTEDVSSPEVTPHVDEPNPVEDSARQAARERVESSRRLEHEMTGVSVETTLAAATGRGIMVEQIEPTTHSCSAGRATLHRAVRLAAARGKEPRVGSSKAVSRKKGQPSNKKAVSAAQSRPPYSYDGDASAMLQTLRWHLDVLKEVRGSPTQIAQVRQQIWLLADIEKGVRTDMDEESVQELLAQLPPVAYSRDDVALEYPAVPDSSDGPSEGAPSGRLSPVTSAEEKLLATDEDSMLESGSVGHAAHTEPYSNCSFRENERASLYEHALEKHLPWYVFADLHCFRCRTRFGTVTQRNRHLETQHGCKFEVRLQRSGQVVVARPVNKSNPVWNRYLCRHRLSAPQGFSVTPANSPASLLYWGVLLALGARLTTDCQQVFRHWLTEEPFVGRESVPGASAPRCTDLTYSNVLKQCQREMLKGTDEIKAIADLKGVEPSHLPVGIMIDSCLIRSDGRFPTTRASGSEVFLCLGAHPNVVQEFDESRRKLALREIFNRLALERPRIIAIGEIGLDVPGAKDSEVCFQRQAVFL